MIDQVGGALSLGFFLLIVLALTYLVKACM
jgi:hypothetical protein